MTSADQRLQFAVTFAESPLEQVTPAQLQALRAQVADFLQGGAQPVPVVGGPGQAVEWTPGQMLTMLSTLTPPPEKVSLKALQNLQREVRTLLHAVARPHSPGAAVGGLETAVRAVVLPFGDANVTALMGMSLRDAFLEILKDLLRVIPNTRLWRCPEERCHHRLFQRKRAPGTPQQYCSPTCTDRANKRAWRKPKRRNDPTWRARENARKQTQNVAKRKRRTA